MSERLTQRIRTIADHLLALANLDDSQRSVRSVREAYLHAEEHVRALLSEVRSSRSTGDALRARVEALAERLESASLAPAAAYGKGPAYGAGWADAETAVAEALRAALASPPDKE